MFTVVKLLEQSSMQYDDDSSDDFEFSDTENDDCSLKNASKENQVSYI